LNAWSSLDLFEGKTDAYTTKAGPGVNYAWRAAILVADRTRLAAISGW
jgi:hypothetical protein